MTVVLALPWPGLAVAATKEDVYIGLFFLSAFPENKPTSFLGVTVPGKVDSGFGAGAKVGLFPDFTNRMIGLELEYFGHGTGLNFPIVASGGDGRLGRSSLIVLSSMANFILRYPHWPIQPYIGVGAGYSQGIIVNENFPGRSDKDFGSTTNFACQFLAGGQANIGQRAFVFSEYKYFSTNYHWSGLSLDFRSHYFAFGVGVRF